MARAWRGINSPWPLEGISTRPNHSALYCNRHAATDDWRMESGQRFFTFGKFAFSQSTISFLVCSGAVCPTTNTSTLRIEVRARFAASLSATDMTSWPQRRNSSAKRLLEFGWTITNSGARQSRAGSAMEYRRQPSCTGWATKSWIPSCATLPQSTSTKSCRNRPMR